MDRIQKVLSSFVIASALAAAPLIASADSVHASSSSSVVINSNGIVRVLGADVTAVGNGVVDAVTNLGSVIVNWIINVSATTKVQAGGSVGTSTARINVGDRVGFLGSLSSSAGNTLTVAARKLRDLASLPPRHADVEATSSAGASGSDREEIRENANASINENESQPGIQSNLNIFGGLRVGGDK